MQARDFYKLKDVIQQLSVHVEFAPDFVVSDEFWQKTSEAIEVLQIPYIATKTMQAVGYGLSDFFISWLRMKRSLGRLNNGQLNLAPHLIEALNERESQLLETPTMMSAMFLDPRIKGRLTDLQRECAIISLEKLYIRLTAKDDQNDSTRNDTLDELNAEALNEFENVNPTSTRTNILLGELRES